jgi:hypothetical protein
MNTLQNVMPMNSMLQAYLKAGFALVPITQGKGPTHKGWNLRENCITSTNQLNESVGYGLAHAYSGTMALDIDDWQQSVTALAPFGIDLNALAAAPDSVMIDSGNPGHAKFLFRLANPLPSKKLIVNGQTIYELRSATASNLTVQDVLPSSLTHPKTQQQYRWAGHGHFSNLPLIPDALLTLWQSMVEQDQARTIDMGEKVNASWEEIQSAVECIPADCSRDEWVRVGMALHYAGTVTEQLDQALYIWNDWSKQSEAKYPGERGIYSQWLSFKTDKASSAKLGTLFHYAKQHGWVRPPIDVSSLFKSADLASPEQVLKRLNPPAPCADLSLFPEVLATRAEQISISVGCDPMVPLWAGLAAVCGVANAESRLELLDGFKVPPLLWLMTIGEPADKKTPGSTPMFKVLEELEVEDRPHHKRRMLDWEGQEAMYSAAHKAFITFSESPEALLGGQAPAVPDLATQPVPLRIKVSDITSQKLVRLTAERPRGLLCHLDEMAGWTRKLCDKSSGEDRSAWTEAYECKTYHMDRVGAGTILAENHAVAIYGNIQPRVLRDAMSVLSADGLLQRFIPVVLDGSLTRKPEPIPPYMQNTGAWGNALRVIFSLPAMTYQLTPDAFTLYRAFQDWYSTKRQDERLLQSDESFMTAFGKLEGLTGRVALVFHMLTSPFDLQVSADTMQRAITLAKAYIVPALRAALCDIGATSSLERWVHDWIIQHADKQTITLSDIKRAARRQLEHIHTNQHDARMMLALIPLEDADYIVRIDDMSTTHRVQWAINPALITQHETYRRQVIDARQRQIDEIYKLSPNEPRKVYGNR